MVERMRELGLEAELQQVEGERVNAIGRWRGEGNGRSLLFNGHVDTNPATEGWTVDPWGGLVDDKFIYGIGVSNMKAGDAAYYWAVKTLIDAGVKLKGDVILSFVVGELQGGVGTLAMLRHGITPFSKKLIWSLSNNRAVTVPSAANKKDRVRWVGSLPTSPARFAQTGTWSTRSVPNRSAISWTSLACAPAILLAERWLTSATFCCFPPTAQPLRQKNQAHRKIRSRHPA